jgi:hypothetical protein
MQDRARDSLENMLFSICRFKQFTRSFPLHITVVSYNFKRTRFLGLHAPALGLDGSMLTFLGTGTLDEPAAKLVLNRHRP